MDYLATFANFSGRDEDLKRIKRYSLYSVMFYRTDLFVHSQRVAWLVKSLSPFFIQVYKNDFDPIKAELMAYVHDDPEFIIGDIQSGIKAKMSKSELEDIAQQERTAIDVISLRFPEKVSSYNYKDLLLAVWGKSSHEARLVKIADRLDAFGESLHEVYAGNRKFVENVFNEYGKIPTPIEQYTRYFVNLLHQYPEVKELRDSELPIVSPPVQYDYISIVRQGEPHTRRSCLAKSGHPYYDFWKSVIFANATSEEQAELWDQKEHLVT